MRGERKEPPSLRGERKEPSLRGESIWRRAGSRTPDGVEAADDGSTPDGDDVGETLDVADRGVDKSSEPLRR